jgi:hypothetical protein
MKIEIKNRFTEAVIFSGDYGSLKECLVSAVKSRANLSGANLSWANLFRADLFRADLYGANLSGAENMDTYLQFGPVGSGHRFLVYNATKKVFQTGCFSGTKAELVKAVKEKHSKTEHLKRYLLAIKSLEAMAKLKA